jgi:hypothetical protein
MRRTKGHWTGLFVAVGLTLCCYAQDAPQTSQPPAPTHQDAPAPEPHPELKPLVEEIRTLLGNGKFQDALPKADELLQQARAKGDKVGEAYALRFRAIALQELRRDHTRPAARSRVGVGVGVGVVARDRRRGVSRWRRCWVRRTACGAQSPEQAQALLAEALQRGTGRGEASVSVAAALNSAGVDWYGIGQLSVGDALAAGVGDTRTTRPQLAGVAARSTIWGCGSIVGLGACGAVVSAGVGDF